MKTNSLKKTNPIRAVSLLPKLAALSALTLFFGVSTADAKPKHHNRGGDRHHHVDRHYHQQHRGYNRYVTPRQIVRSTWVRPGYTASYPRAGYVDNRYIYSLPRGYRVIYRGGHPYYYADGCYYQSARYNNRGVYIRVNF